MIPIPHPSKAPALPKLTHVIIGLCLYFGIQLLLTPLVMKCIGAYFAGSLPLWREWSALLSFSLACLSLIFYTYILTKYYGIAIWSLSKTPPLSRMSALFYGIACWPLVALCIWITITLVQLIFPGLFSIHQIDQIPVKQLKNSAAHPTLFAAMLLSVLVMAPISEELLFRGLLQRMFLKKYRLWVAITWTAFFFALLHCSSAQGWRNVEIFLALFLLAWIQGYLYEMTQQLSAPIGLHITFNTATVLMLFYTSALPFKEL